MKNAMKLLMALMCLTATVQVQAQNNEDCACFTLYDPVCGDNGITYSNYCFAACEGVEDYSMGECAELTPIVVAAVGELFSHTFDLGPNETAWDGDWLSLYSAPDWADASVVTGNFSSSNSFGNWLLEVEGTPTINDLGENYFVIGSTSPWTGDVYIVDTITVSVINNCICPAVAAPVCGVDGNTYGNSCEAACANVEVAYDGMCSESSNCLADIEIIGQEVINGFAGPMLHLQVMNVGNDLENINASVELGICPSTDNFTFDAWTEGEVMDMYYNFACLSMAPYIEPYAAQLTISSPAVNCFDSFDFEFDPQGGNSTEGCTDADGTFYANGEQWNPDDCTFCSCEEGGIFCAVVDCAMPPCDNPVYIEGQCCPVCEEEGCTDPEAVNFSFEAVVDDGSCEYDYNTEYCNFLGNEVSFGEVVYYNGEYCTCLDMNIPAWGFLSDAYMSCQPAGCTLEDGTFYAVGETQEGECETCMCSPSLTQVYPPDPPSWTCFEIADCGDCSEVVCPPGTQCQNGECIPDEIYMQCVADNGEAFPIGYAMEGECETCICTESFLDVYPPAPPTWQCFEIADCGMVYGCMNPDAINFNPDATFDDGSCVIPGECIGTDGVSYGIGDGYTVNCESCECIEMPSIPGMPTLGAWNCEEVVDCEEDVYGCTSYYALNYNPEAVYDDGSCEFNQGCYEGEELITINVSNNLPAYFTSWNLSQTYYGGGGGMTQLCLWEGCYDFGMNSGNPENWESSSVLITDSQGNTLLSLENGHVGSASFAVNTQQECNEMVYYIPGCIDENALNFDPDANYNVGCEYDGCYLAGEVFIPFGESITEDCETCVCNSPIILDNGMLSNPWVDCFEIEDCGIEIYGCTDSTAINFNPEATIPDGSCIIFPCYCPEVYAPVCGSNGVTYGNDCEASCAGITEYYNGQCLPTSFCEEIEVIAETVYDDNGQSILEVTVFNNSVNDINYPQFNILTNIPYVTLSPLFENAYQIPAGGSTTNTYQITDGWDATVLVDASYYVSSMNQNAACVYPISFVYEPNSGTQGCFENGEFYPIGAVLEGECESCICLPSDATTPLETGAWICEEIADCNGLETDCPSATFNEEMYLPDGAGMAYTTSIMMEVEEGQVLTDIDNFTVSINIEHSYIGDLDIFLTAPNGQQVELLSQGCGGTWFGEATDGDATDSNPGIGYDYGWSMNPSYNGTMLDACSSNIIEDPNSYGDILVPETYLPVESFEVLEGTPLNGLWELTVVDNLMIDNGWVFSWGISLCEGEGVYGCTDPTAINYNPEATMDDGSCISDCICLDVYSPVCGSNGVTYGNACYAECEGVTEYYNGECLPTSFCEEIEVEAAMSFDDAGQSILEVTVYNNSANAINYPQFGVGAVNAYVNITPLFENAYYIGAGESTTNMYQVTGGGNMAMLVEASYYVGAMNQNAACEYPISFVYEPMWNTQGCFENGEFYPIGAVLEVECESCICLPSDANSPLEQPVWSCEPTGQADCNDINYVLYMYDVWGDGWNGAEMTITNTNGDLVGVYTMDTGSVESVELDLVDGCYHIEVEGGSYVTSEISWAITENHYPAVYEGGAPFSGIFSVNADCGEEDDNYCEGLSITSTNVNTEGVLEVFLLNTSNNIFSYPQLNVIGENGQVLAQEETWYYGIGTESMHSLEILVPMSEWSANIMLQVNTNFGEEFACEMPIDFEDPCNLIDCAPGFDCVNGDCVPTEPQEYGCNDDAGNFYAFGETMQQDCNTCTCTPGFNPNAEGFWMCTMMPCEEECAEGETSYELVMNFNGMDSGSFTIHVGDETYSVSQPENGLTAIINFCAAPGECIEVYALQTWMGPPFTHSLYADGVLVSENEYQYNCNSEEIYGCTVPEAVNYNPEATIDDGSCEFGSIDCNLDIEILHHGLLLVEEQPVTEEYYHMQLVNNGDDLSNLSFSLDIDEYNLINSSSEVVDVEDWQSGDTLDLAFLINNGIYLPWPMEPGPSYLEVSFGNGCYEAISIEPMFMMYGCTDPDAINHNPWATIDDGSCVFTSVGCEFEGELYDFGSTVEMGCNTCFCQAGFNPNESGIWSCTEMACSGCTDPDAINYDEYADEDDGSCEYDAICTGYEALLTVNMEAWAVEHRWELLNSSGEVLYSGGPYQSYTVYEIELCLEENTSYVMSLLDDYGDGWNGGSFSISSADCELVSGGLEIGQNAQFEFETSCEDSGMPDWTYDNTGTNHTIVIPENVLVDINGISVEQGDWMGVFYQANGQLNPAGYVVWEGATTMIAAQGDDLTTVEIDGFQNGEIFQWMLWDESENMVYLMEATYMADGQEMFAVNGISTLVSLSTIPQITQQAIDLNTGWNLFSTYMQSNDMSVDAVCSAFVEDLIILKNNDGLAYLPAWGFNGIGDIVAGQGYQAKLENAQELVVEGTYLAPEDNPINLTNGWNMIAYLRVEPASVVSVFEEIDDLVIVKNNTGMAYLPDYGFNGIGDMEAGQAYQVKVLSDQVLQYNSNDESYRLEEGKVFGQNLNHFTSPINTGSNMSVVIPKEAWTTLPSNGDELVVYDAERNIVGAFAYQNETMVIPVYGDDELTSNKDGLSLGEEFEMVLWSKKQDQSFTLPIVWAINGGEYENNSVQIVQSISSSLSNESLHSIALYPNPAATQVELSFVVVEEQNVEVLIYNVLGDVVLSNPTKHFGKGQANLFVDLSAIPSGTYFVKIQSDDKVFVESLVVE